MTMDPATKQAVRQRLDPVEADAFLARLDLLAPDITGPLTQLYGGRADVDALVADCVRDALDATVARPRCGGSTAAGRSTRPGSSGLAWSATSAIRTGSRAP
jgi:hypothetical protein